MAKMPLMQTRMPEPDLKELEKIAKERGLKLPELVRRLLSKALREKLYEQV